MSSGLERATGYLKEAGFGDRIKLFKASTATVALAAEQVGCEEAHIAKTLGFYDKHEGGALLIVAAGDAKVDNRRFKDVFGFKPSMLKGEDVEELTGYAPGGVCPFDVAPGATLYLDESLYRFEVVYPACGNASSAVRLSLPELENLTGAAERRIDICKAWREEN